MKSAIWKITLIIFIYIFATACADYRANFDTSSITATNNQSEEDDSYLDDVQITKCIQESPVPWGWDELNPFQRGYKGKRSVPLSFAWLSTTLGDGNQPVSPDEKQAKPRPLGRGGSLNFELIIGH